MKLTLTEKETIILFNECEKTAKIYTFNNKLKKKIITANEKYPELFKIKCKDKNGAMTCELPKDRLSINLKSPPKLETSQKRSEQMLARHKARRNNTQICTNLNTVTLL